MIEREYTKIKINTEYITFGQFLKFVNLISNGGEAKNYFLNHECFVNEIKIESRGKKLFESDKIVIDNSLFFEIVK